MSPSFEGGAKWLGKNISQTDLNWKTCEIVGLFNSSNLQVTISRVTISVLKGRPKRKFRPTRELLSSRKPIIFSFLFFSYFFFDGSGQRVIFSLYNYNAKYLKENFTVRRIIFSLRIDKWKQTISFSASNCNTAPYNFALKKKKK